MAKFKIEHIVKSENPSTRLDMFLKSLGVRLSRTRIIELIDSGKALVNGKISKPSYRVKQGDHILVEYEVLVKTDLKPEDIPLKIIYEDDQIIVLDKEKGMVVHPAKGNREGTIVNALLHHTKISGGDVERPGVVHRLDKDTTGVMVFAKNERAHQYLANEIEKRAMKRTYLAIVWGEFVKKVGRIDAPIGRSNIDRRLMTVTDVNSKEAVTTYRVLKNFKICSLLKINLLTGRTHQIRVHMHYAEHPVVGDKEYKKNVYLAIKDLPVDLRKHFDSINNLMDRQALHSVSLTFRHPSDGRFVSFYSPLPEDFRRVLDYLWNLEKEKS